MLKIDVHEDKKILKAFDKKDIEYEVKGLPIGDIVYNNICIERKTPQDFYGSILSQRIFLQSLNMQKNYKHNFIIIVGDYNALRYSRYIKFFNSNIFWGAITSLITKYHMQVVMCKNNAELVYITKKIIEKLDDGTAPEEVLRISRNDPTTVKTSMLACIPGVSVVRADSILKHFDITINLTPKTSDITNISQIKGLGLKTCSEVDKYVNKD